MLFIANTKADLPYSFNLIGVDVTPEVQNLIKCDAVCTSSSELYEKYRRVKKGEIQYFEDTDHIQCENGCIEQVKIVMRPAGKFSVTGLVSLRERVYGDINDL